MNWFLKHINNFFVRKEKVISIIIPYYFMNCGVSVDNNFTCDTNNSTNFYEFVCPLPKPKHKWEIRYVEEVGQHQYKIVYLIDKKDRHVTIF